MVWLLLYVSGIVLLRDAMLIGLIVRISDMLISYIARLRVVDNFVNNSMFFIIVMTDMRLIDRDMIGNRLRWLLLSTDDVSRYEGGECL